MSCAKRPASPNGGHTSRVRPEVLQRAQEKIGAELTDRLDTKKHPKAESHSLVSELKKKLKAQIPEEDEKAPGQAQDTITRLCGSASSASRSSTRSTAPTAAPSIEIRAIWVEAGVLPRTHGSAIFTRGETQALVSTTLGTSDDMQRLETFEGEAKKRFMLHYNFPPFSVGEVAFLRGAGRREIGHGALAERAISAVLPAEDKWPYAMRVVSDILESNGSSSMAYGLRSFAFADGCWRSAEGSGCGSGHGIGEGRRRLCHPDRYRGR